MTNVIIDPGHGGSREEGGSSPTGSRGSRGVLEKNVTLAVARHVAGCLGKGVILTRDGDHNLTLAARAGVARRSMAPVFISLHANRGPSGARGGEIWLHHRTSRASHALAQALRRSVSRRCADDVAIHAGDMGVLTPEALDPGTAACLFEIDYLSHPEGERRLRDAGALSTLGRAIAAAVRAYLAGAGRRQPASALDVTSDSSQGEQSNEVRRHIAESLQAKEGTRFDQVHYDSARVNFGIGSWTGPRIAALLDTYEEVATEEDETDTLYGYFGDKASFDDLRSRFRKNGVPSPMDAAEKRALEQLGGNKTLREAQIRQLADDVKGAVDAIGKSGKYWFIDAYMSAISEVAAHVLVHATHQHGQVDDLIAVVTKAHGGEDKLGDEMVNGTVTENQILMEIGEEVVKRVKPEYKVGVRARYKWLIDRYGTSDLAYYFNPAAPSSQALDEGDEEIRYALQDGKVNKVAIFSPDGCEGQGTMIFTFAKDEYRIPMWDIYQDERTKQPEGFRTARNIPTVVAVMTYILLYAFQHWKYDYGARAKFEYKDKTYLGRFNIHNDGPGGPRPNDHPGVDLFEQVP